MVIANHEKYEIRTFSNSTKKVLLMTLKCVAHPVELGIENGRKLEPKKCFVWNLNESVEMRYERV